jgi:hypothetical protein
VGSTGVSTPGGPESCPWGTEVETRPAARIEGYPGWLPKFFWWTLDSEVGRTLNSKTTAEPWVRGRCQHNKEGISDLRPTHYPRSLTFRLTKGWRDYILEQAETAGTTLTQVVRDALLAHREAQKRSEPTRSA